MIWGRDAEYRFKGVDSGMANADNERIVFPYRHRLLTDGQSNDRTAAAIAELLEAVSRDLRSRAFAGGLNPAQWAALRFFARANASARTVTAFAAAHRTTSGTATRTVAALVRKNHLTRFPLPADRRVSRLDLTKTGKMLLRADPLRGLIEVVWRLSDLQRAALLEGLLTLSKATGPGADENSQQSHMRHFGASDLFLAGSRVTRSDPRRRRRSRRG
jgi:DNA-binding MarR family transcriptional regulator